MSFVEITFTKMCLIKNKGQNVVGTIKYTKMSLVKQHAPKCR